MAGVVAMNASSSSAAHALNGVAVVPSPRRSGRLAIMHPNTNENIIISTNINDYILILIFIISEYCQHDCYFT